MCSSLRDVCLSKLRAKAFADYKDYLFCAACHTHDCRHPESLPLFQLNTQNL